MKFASDIDIDLADRARLLKLIQHVPASIVEENRLSAHNTGIYATAIPVDPLTGRASIDYRAAEQRGYIKIDLLNLGVYGQVKDPDHLDQLLATPAPWHRLQEREFVEQLIHIGRHYSTLQAMPEPVDSIPRMAMFLAVIRPAKRHLLGLHWNQVAETVWQQPQDTDIYWYKKSHSIAYAQLVVLHMNLLNLSDQGN